MDSTYKKSIKITSQDIDFKEELSFQKIMAFFQDIATEHSFLLGIDRWTLLEKCNCFWVITKIKIKIFKMPKLNDELVAETWTLNPGVIKFDRDGVFWRNGEKMISIKSEWVCLDKDTHMPVRSKNIEYPFELKNREDRSFEENFENVNFEESQTVFCYEKNIKVSDLDLNRHVNNTFYANFSLDAFSSTQLKKDIEFLEIHFQNECFEEDNLKMFVKNYEENGKNKSFIQGKVLDKSVFKTILTWK